MWDKNVESLFQEGILGKSDADSTYYYATETCFRNRRFSVEMMHGGSIYENQIETFSEV